MQSLDPGSVKLLRRVANPRKDDAEIVEAVTGIRTWKQAIDAAREHGVIPALQARLAVSPAHIPADALRLVKAEFERNAFHCMTNAEELLEVLQAFDQVGIPAIPFKGVVLAASAYGDLTARAAGDIDLLIHPNDLPKATQILEARNYELITAKLEDGSPRYVHQYEHHFERESDGMVLELRWRLELTQPRYRENLGLDWVWSRQRTAKLLGAEVPDLDPVSNLLVLCMHGSKHAWSRLIWICDVARLLEREPELDWNLAQREARRVGLWRCLALGVLLAHRVAGAEVPREVLHKFEANRAMRNLAQFLDDNLLAGSGSLPARRIPYYVRILDFRDRLRAVLSPSLLQPNERDRSVVRLPKMLEPLYFLIRPFRLLVDRTGR